MDYVLVLYMLSQCRAPADFGDRRLPHLSISCHLQYLYGFTSISHCSYYSIPLSSSCSTTLFLLLLQTSSVLLLSSPGILYYCPIFLALPHSILSLSKIFSKAFANTTFQMLLSSPSVYSSSRFLIRTITLTIHMF